MKSINHTWEEADKAAEAGRRIADSLWPDGTFVFRQVPSEVPEVVVPKMSSLPPDVKAEFVRRGGPLKYSHQWAVVLPDNRIRGWMPEEEDFESDRWTIFHEDAPNNFTAAPVAETAGTAKPL